MLDYYNIPVSTPSIYGLTGIAFLLIHDQSFKKPNAGSDSDIYKLARNIGLEVDGVCRFAENEEYIELQKEFWIKAKEAINNGIPVFSKNIDIENQTSLVYGYDEKGYYTHSWHSGEGHDNWDNVIPWDKLGQALCPCSYCKSKRGLVMPRMENKGLISLHWATVAPMISISSALKDAFEYVIRLNDQGVISWGKDMYFVGGLAYKEWINALKQDLVNKYHFSLTLEPISDARNNAVLFFNEVKEIESLLPSSLIAEAIEVYEGISQAYKKLVRKFPYEQPFEAISTNDKEESIDMIQFLMQQEEKATNIIRRMFKELKT